MKWHVLLFWLEESRLNQSTSLALLLTIQRLWSLIFPQNLGSCGSYVCVGGGGRVYMWVWYACGKQRSTLCLESGSLIGLELAEKASMAGQGAQGRPCLFLSNAGVAMRHDACMGAGVTMRHNACMGAGVTMRHDTCLGPGVTMRHGCWGYNETWCLHGCWGPNSDLHACMAYFALWTIFLFSGFTKGCLCSHAM